MKKNNKIFIAVSKIILILFIIFTSRYVFLKIFFNQKETKVPYVLFMPVDEAIKIISKYDLKYNIIYSKAPDVEENFTFIQFPEANKKVKVNRKIQIWVNKKDSNEIPDIIGKNLIEARVFLEKLNINIERIDYISNINQKEDKVLAIYPKVGSKIGENQKVSLLVSTKSLVKDTIMPNLIGLNLLEARKILNEVNQNIKTITETNDTSFPNNVIVATNPNPGEFINRNTQISIVVNTGVELNKTVDEIVEEKIQNDNGDIDVEEILEKTLRELKNKSNKGE